MDDQVSESKKSFGARMGEATFCILYLVTLVVFLFLMTHFHNGVEGGEMFRTERVRYFFGFLLTLLLFAGDSVHLVPRIIMNIRGSIPRQNFFLGLGNLISSITMTVFYNVLIRLGDSMEYHGEAYNLWVEQAILFLTIVRIFLLILPQNEWFSDKENRTWAWLRNAPFAMIGVLTVVGFTEVIRHASNYPTGMYVQIIVATILSFAFYFPVVLFGKSRPQLGMLMIPKTLCYIWMLAVIL